ncbi:MAG TPA: VCBS repeat-containing protein, partial [Gemmataceae bacterium]|nr:VCBS repeat-containing protein [Gemmataceae bacterium]
MKSHRRLLCSLVVIAAGLLLTWLAQPAYAYVEAPHSLGLVVQLSTNIMVLRVEKVDKQNNLIIYRKVRDLKGVHPTDVVKHNIGRNGFHPREWQYTMDWAEVGKTAVFFHNGGASETCIGNYWYQCYAGGEWWGMSHGEPFLLRSYSGQIDKLASAVADIVANKEVIVPSMVDGNKDDLHLRRARIQRLRASLKLLDYNPKRDFVGWGGEDFRRITGMPGFTHYSALTRVDPDAQAISSLDFNGDGKPDLCLVGAGKIALLQNSGEALGEISLPGVSGCRSAVWADYNGDGKPDLLLATPTGPKLFTNLGTSFRDDSHLLPKEACYNLTAAAWIDQDGDGKPDILLGNGFHGLRLYRNKGPAPPGSVPLAFGDWRYIGPFDFGGGKGFDHAFPPEKEIDFKKKYPGKNGEEATWHDAQFRDGEINNLALFKPENNVQSVAYVYREIDSTTARDIPVSLGSDDTLTVWLNGQKILAQNVMRSIAPDQAQVVLKLKPGKNRLLLKICQADGDWSFYFLPKVTLPPAVTWAFQDVSAEVGLGPNGIGSAVKGDTLTVCDVNGDGRPDFLYGAGTGMLVLNTPGGFIEAKDSGIVYQPGKIGPVFGDFDNDGHPDLFVPQNGTCKLFRNDGKGHFTDVTAQAGDLAAPIGMATCAAWGDFFNDGRLDLVVGCLRGPNRLFRNKGDGTFQDATDEVGLRQRIFNTQAVCLVDLNGDGMLDMVFNNEGQESAVLLGNPAIAAKRIPVTLQVAG